jgi:hypothetical protein
MDQVNGSRFKLVYTHWIDTEDHGRIPLPNGLPLIIADAIIEHCKTYKPIVDSRYFRLLNLKSNFQNPSTGFLYKHSNLLYYFKKHYSMNNIVDESQIIEDNCTYFLPFEIEGSNVDYIHAGTSFVLNEQTYHYNFKDNISPTLLEHLRSGKVKLLITNLIELSICDKTLCNLETYLSSLGIDGKNINVLQGHIRKDFYEKKLGNIKLGTSHASLEQQVEIAHRYPINRTGLGYASDIVRESDLNMSTIRNKKFLCWNRTMERPHRVGLCYLALKYNLLENSTFTFLNFLDTKPWPIGNKLNIAVYLKKIIDTSVIDLVKITRDIDELVPYEIDTQHLSFEDRQRFQTNENNKKEVYADSYIHIVSETLFDDFSSPFMSEKTFRPIANLQPFIYVGNYLALEELKRLGFKTFHPYIDESYDLERDPKKRFYLIEQEIKKFVDMSQEQIHKWYYSVADILIFNQRHFMSLKDYNPLEDFFNTF